MGEKFEFLLHLGDEKCHGLCSFCDPICRRLIAQGGDGAVHQGERTGEAFLGNFCKPS